MFRLLPAVLLSFGALTTSAFAGVTFDEKPDRVTVSIDGEVFTEYRHGDAPHVYYWPVLGPGGVKMTRSYPMETVEGEAMDHRHHRSLWFSHGAVNGLDFWGESATSNRVGRIEHVKVLAAEGGKESGVLKTEQKWVAPDGTVPVRSVQTLRVHSTPATERMFDFEITLTAADKDAVFGDTKEGSAGIRIAESMRLKQPKAPGQGHIVNSEGLEDGKVWGQRAKWVMMSGPIGGKTYAITFMDHPSNMRHPTRWHARDYGLFAANPFCEAEMDKSKPKGSGEYTLKAGESLTLKYRIVITEGDAASAHAAERYAQYAGAGR